MHSWVFTDLFFILSWPYGVTIDIVQTLDSNYPFKTTEEHKKICRHRQTSQWRFWAGFYEETNAKIKNAITLSKLGGF